MSHEAAYVLAASEKWDLMRLSSPVRMALSQSSNCRSYMSLLRSSSNCRAGVYRPHQRRQCVAPLTCCLAGRAFMCGPSDPAWSRLHPHAVLATAQQLQTANSSGLVAGFCC